MGRFREALWRVFADNSIGTYMTTAIFPSMLREDPRYYQMGKGRFVYRAYHAINRLFVIRTDSGHERFNYSNPSATPRQPPSRISIMCRQTGRLRELRRLLLSDSVRRDKQRIEGILAGYSPQGVSQGCALAQPTRR